MELNEEWADFRNEMLSVLQKYAHIVGPQDGDEGVEVNNQETVPTDAIVVVNWHDMDTNSSFLSGYPLTKSNPSMLLGMLIRVGDKLE